MALASLTGLPSVVEVAIPGMLYSLPELHPERTWKIEFN